MHISLSLQQAKKFLKKKPTFFPQEHENCNMILYSVQTKHMLKEEV